jgi:hypothetical protein
MVRMYGMYGVLGMLDHAVESNPMWRFKGGCGTAEVGYVLTSCVEKPLCASCI